MGESASRQINVLECPAVMGFPGGSAGKEPACNTGVTGDVGSIPGLGRSPGGGHGNPLQCSCQENPLDKGGWRGPWGHKELAVTEATEHAHTHSHSQPDNF